MKIYQYHHSLRRQRSQTASVYSIPADFWQSPKLRHWSSTQDSALTIIVGNFKARSIMRNLCVDIIEQLQEAEVPVLLAMRPPQNNDIPAKVSSQELLKYLVRQAIQLRHNQQTEKTMALRCATFQCASTEREWFQILEAVVAEIHSQIYVIIDLEVLDRDLGPVDGFSWALAFEKFFNQLSLRGLATKVKVLLFSYGSLPFHLPVTDYSKFVVSAKTQITTARRKKAGKGAKTAQVPFRLQSLPGASTRSSISKGIRRR